MCLFVCLFLSVCFCSTCPTFCPCEGVCAVSPAPMPSFAPVSAELLHASSHIRPNFYFLKSHFASNPFLLSLYFFPSLLRLYPPPVSSFTPPPFPSLPPFPLLPSPTVLLLPLLLLVSCFPFGRDLSRMPTSDPEADLFVLSGHILRLPLVLSAAAVPPAGGGAVLLCCCSLCRWCCSFSGVSFFCCSLCLR